MTWTKLDDGFWMHPRVLMAGNTAAGIFARMMSYCGAYLTDGLIPGEAVDTIAGRDKRALEDLERTGLIQRMESGAAFIPDYLDYNRSKAQVEADREDTKARQAAWREKRRNGRATA